MNQSTVQNAIAGHIPQSAIVANCSLLEKYLGSYRSCLLVSATRVETAGREFAKKDVVRRESLIARLAAGSGLQVMHEIESAVNQMRCSAEATDYLFNYEIPQLLTLPAGKDAASLRARAMADRHLPQLRNQLMIHVWTEEAAALGTLKGKIDTMLASDPTRLAKAQAIIDKEIKQCTDEADKLRTMSPFVKNPPGAGKSP